MNVVDRTGNRYGRLVVLRRNGSDRCVLWLCRCDCGKLVTVKGDNLQSGNTKSCGCSWKSPARAVDAAIRATVHGYHKKRIYRIWSSMLYRCRNPRSKDWKDYGGRGIKVCKRWHKFENFLADMGEPPLGLTLDRKDNDKGYNKKNCRWATRKQQMNNRRPSSQWKRRVNQIFGLSL